MKQTSNPQSDMNTVNERLAQAFYSSRRYNPLLIAVAGIGFIAIFLLTRIAHSWRSQLLNCCISVYSHCYLRSAEIPMLALAQQNKGIAANLYATAIGGLFAILVTLLWQGIALDCHTDCSSDTSPGNPQWNATQIYLETFVDLLLAAAGRYFLRRSKFSGSNRLQNSNSAAIASIVFLLATVLLLINNYGYFTEQKIPKSAGLAADILCNNRDHTNRHDSRVIRHWSICTTIRPRPSTASRQSPPSK